MLLSEVLRRGSKVVGVMVGGEERSDKTSQSSRLDSALSTRVVS